MDERLCKLAFGDDPAEEKVTLVKISAFDEKTGEVELDTPNGLVSYHLKPMDELFGKGYGSSVDPQDETYMPLLMAIESAIARHYETHPELTDGQALLSLRGMSMNPAADCVADALCKRVQLGVRVALSFHDYSKQEAKQAIRKVMASVERHTRSGGPRGYLNFIRDYV